MRYVCHSHSISEQMEKTIQPPEQPVNCNRYKQQEFVWTVATQPGIASFLEADSYVRSDLHLSFLTHILQMDRSLGRPPGQWLD